MQNQKTQIQFKNNKTGWQHGRVHRGQGRQALYNNSPGKSKVYKPPSRGPGGVRGPRLGRQGA